MIELRCLLTRSIYLSLSGIILASLWLLPRDHPARIFTNGRMREARPAIRSAMIAPKSTPRFPVNVSTVAVALAGTALAYLIDQGAF